MKSAEELWTALVVHNANGASVIAAIEARDAEWRRLVEEAKADLTSARAALLQSDNATAKLVAERDIVKAKFALHTSEFPALKAQVDRLKSELAAMIGDRDRWRLAFEEMEKGCTEKELELAIAHEAARRLAAPPAGQAQGEGAPTSPGTTGLGRSVLNHEPVVAGQTGASPPASIGGGNSFGSCECVRPEVPCVGVCTTVERWADACRRAHWWEDDTLLPWFEFVAKSDSNDGSEANLWRRIARDAIESMHNDPDDAPWLAQIEHNDPVAELAKRVEALEDRMDKQEAIGGPNWSVGREAEHFVTGRGREPSPPPPEAAGPGHAFSCNFQGANPANCTDSCICQACGLDKGHPIHAVPPIPEGTR